jgi:succinoglycan biosynthesis transport protein ExoP
MSSRPLNAVDFMNSANMNSSAQQPANASSAQAFNIHSVLNALRCWWKIAAPMALLLAAAASGVVYYLHKPQYTATCELLIKEKPDVILKALNADSKKYINNQVEIIKSQRLLGPLLSKPEIASTPELAKEEDKVAALARLIKVAQKAQSDFYVLSVTSESPEKAELIVKATSEAYLDFYRKRESEQDDVILQLLEKQKADRTKEMNQLHDKLRTMTINLTGVDPFRASSKDEEGTKAANPFAGLKAEIVRAQVEQDILAGRIQLAEKFVAETTFEVPMEELEKRVEADSTIVALRAHIEQLRDRESKFQETAKNPSANPQFKQLQMDIEASVRDLDARKPKLRRDITEGLKREYASAQANKIKQMKQDWNDENAKLISLRGVLEKEMGGETTTAKVYAGGNFELEDLKNKYVEAGGLVKELSSRILMIATEQKAPERVELFKPVTRPVSPNEIVPWKQIGMGAAVAFLVPFAFAVGWEQLFRRVTSRGQLETANRLCVVGEVTSLPAKKRGSGQKNQTERNVMLFEESVDCLRTYLSLGKSSQDSRILAVTSAVSQEGKTTLAAQLAVSIARATGEMTLLIDGDMRSPEIHEIFDTELGPGLADVLRGECPVEEAIETGFSEKLHVLTAGRLTTSPHQLLGRGEFRALVEKLSTMYGHIVIDTPPILPASEALIMARAADMAVLCVRRDYSRLDQVEEANRRMTGAGVNTAGAVLNGIPHQHYAHKYGSYYYNRSLPPQSAKLN